MTLHSLYMRPALMLSLFVGGVASAADPAGVEATVHSTPPRNYGNLRIGASSSGHRSSLCLEVSPLERLSLEGCGTGAGFLHHDPEPELAHFRLWLSLTSWKTELGWLQPRIGAGFVELQVGQDSSGFYFSGVGPTGVETTGPEVGASLRLLIPLTMGTELVGEVGVSAAWLPYAPELVMPQSTFQPNASFSLGVGF